MTKVEQNTMEIETGCPFCGKASTIQVIFDDFVDWRYEGKCAQDAFPYLSPEQREQIISGICPTCWKDMFEGCEQ